VAPAELRPSGKIVSGTPATSVFAISEPARTTSFARSRSTKIVPAPRATHPNRGQVAISRLATNRLG
jgi:hypothetical protein